MMTSRFWEIIVIELVFINEFKSPDLGLDRFRTQIFETSDSEKKTIIF